MIQLHIIVPMSLGVQMERDPPLGVGPAILNKAQMYGQVQNTAVITSYLQSQQSLRALSLIVLASELRLG